MNNKNKAQKYYWFKLKLSFLDSPKVDFLMSQNGGANYVVIYQMLCLKAINTNGKLETSVKECRIKWDDAKIQRELKYFEIDTIRIAMTLFLQLGLIVPDEEGILQIQDFSELVGSETGAAIEKREQRKRIDKGIDKGIDNVYPENRDKSIEYRYKNIENIDNINNIYNTLEDKKDKKDKKDKTPDEVSKNPFIIFLLSKNFFTKKDYIEIPLIEEFYDSLLEGYSLKSPEWIQQYKNIFIATKYMVTYASNPEIIEDKLSYIKTAISDSLNRNYNNSDWMEECERYFETHPELKRY